MISANSMAMRAFSFVGLGASRSETRMQSHDWADPPARSALDEESVDNPFAPGGEAYKAVATALAAAGLLED